MSLFISRLIRASKLQPSLYEEVEADSSALSHAVAVIIISSIAAGLGSVDRIDPLELLSGTVGALGGWFLWALLTLLIGAKLFPEPQTQADYGQLLRTIGFSSSPGIIRVLGVVAAIREPIFLIASIWMLIAMIIAIRQALDYTSTLRAVLVAFAGWVIQLLLLGATLLLIQSL